MKTTLLTIFASAWVTAAIGQGTTVTVPAGGCISIADNYYLGNNSLAQVLPNVADGTSVHKWDSNAQAYKAAYIYLAGFGWFSDNPDDPGPNGPTLKPGEGAFLFSDVSQAFTFGGTIANPPARVRPPAGAYLMGCPRPTACAFDELMGFPPVPGDRVLFYNHPSNC